MAEHIAFLNLFPNIASPHAPVHVTYHTCILYPSPWSIFGTKTVEIGVKPIPYHLLDGISCVTVSNSLTAEGDILDGNAKEENKSKKKRQGQDSNLRAQKASADFTTGW